MSYRGFIDLILDMAHLDPLKFEAFKRIDSALTELYRNVEGISASPQSVIPAPVTSGHWNKVGQFLSPLAPADNVQLLFSGALFMEGGLYTPTTIDGQAASFRVIAINSLPISANAFPVRPSTWQFYDTVVDRIDNSLMNFDVIQTSNPTAGLIRKTCIHANIFTQPDNGGETSAILCLQTGGGNAFTAHKRTLIRPAGFTDYWDSPQVAGEFATDGGSAAIIGIAGHPLGVATRSADCIVARQDYASSVAAGFRSEPGNGTFDTRVAYAVSGRASIGGALSTIKFQVLYNGHVDVGGTHANNTLGAGSQCALKIINRNVGAVGRLAELQFGLSESKVYASIAGYLADGANDTAGDLVMGIRNISTDANLTERFRIQTGGNFAFNGSAGAIYGGASGAIFIANAGTNPSTNPTGGGLLYVTGGALTWRGSGGTVTTIAVA